jgi:hypothetical protein
MTTLPILFNQPPDSLRRIGARGDRDRARYWRLRQRTDLAVPSVIHTVSCQSRPRWHGPLWQRNRHLRICQEWTLLR